MDGAATKERPSRMWAGKGERALGRPRIKTMATTPMSDIVKSSVGRTAHARAHAHAQLTEHARTGGAHKRERACGRKESEE